MAPINLTVLVPISTKKTGEAADADLLGRAVASSAMEVIELPFWGDQTCKSLVCPGLVEFWMVLSKRNVSQFRDIKDAS